MRSNKNNGSLYGFSLGAIAGVLLAGPNFQVWTPLESILTILGGGIVLGLIGHFAFALFLGTAGAGNTDEYTAPSTDEAISLNDMGD